MFPSIRRARRPSRRSAAVDIAPLIDLVFILLIFFLVSSSLVRDTGLAVERPEAVGAGPLDADSVRIYITAGGAIRCEGREVDLDEVRELVARRAAPGGGLSVVVVPDRRASAGRLVAVFDAAQLGGAGELAVATRPPGEVEP